jgi:hypothetical protein
LVAAANIAQADPTEVLRDPHEIVRRAMNVYVDARVYRDSGLLAVDILMQERPVKRVRQRFRTLFSRDAREGGFRFEMETRYEVTRTLPLVLRHTFEPEDTQYLRGSDSTQTTIATFADAVAESAEETFGAAYFSARMLMPDDTRDAWIDTDMVAVQPALLEDEWIDEARCYRVRWQSPAAGATKILWIDRQLYLVRRVTTIEEEVVGGLAYRTETRIDYVPSLDGVVGHDDLAGDLVLSDFFRESPPPAGHQTIVTSERDLAGAESGSVDWVFARVERAYAALGSYRDTGTVSRRWGPPSNVRVLEGEFETVFEAPSSLRFVYEEERSDMGHLAYSLQWPDSEGTAALVVNGDVRSEPTLELAVASLSGCTNGAALFVPQLLIPLQIGSPGVTNTNAFATRRLDNAMIGSSECFVFEQAMLFGNKRTLWIDATTFLIRRVAMRLNLSQSESTIDYAPVIGIREGEPDPAVASDGR